MVNNFFGGLTDLVSSVTTVVKEVSQEVVRDVQGTVQAQAQAAASAKDVVGKENAKQNAARQQQQHPKQQVKRSDNSCSTAANTPTKIPSSLDLHHVTDRLWVMPQPTVENGNSSCRHPEDTTQQAQQQQQQHRNDVTVLADYLERNASRHTVFNASDTPADDALVTALQGQIVQCPWRSPSAPRSETPNLSAMLDICYALHATLQLDDDDDDDLDYNTTKSNNNTTKSVAIVYCANGKTRTALVVACYLAYAGHSRNVMEGFVTFLQQTQQLSATTTTMNDNKEAYDVWHACPPSLHTFARNFTETCCQEGGFYRNPKPLLLRAIALQGIPVEDKPCLDIWDGQQRHVYSSHPALWTDLVDTSTATSSAMIASSCKSSLDMQQVVKEDDDNDGNAAVPPTAPQPPQESLQTSMITQDDLLQEAREQELPPDGDSDSNQPTPPLQAQHELLQQQQQQQASQWADEEGFYRVNVVLEGDFCLLCRFGGIHANSDKDPTKVLFRYANTTVGMGAGGPYELPPSQVDLMRRYASCFDPDDFLCTLLLEAHWNVAEPHWQTRLQGECQSLPPVYQSNDILALQRGWKLLEKYAVVQPTTGQVEELLHYYHSQESAANSSSVSKELAKLCLQQSNLNMEHAMTALASLATNDTSSPMSRLMQVLNAQPAPLPSLPTAEDEDSDDASIEEEAQTILNILDSIDFGDEFDEYQPPVSLNYGNDRSVVLERQPKKDGEGHASGKHSQKTKSPSLPTTTYSSPFLHMPRQGEIVNAFGEYYQDIHKGSANKSLSQQIDTSKALAMGSSFPQLPLQFSAQSSANKRLYSPVDDPANASAVELLLKMNHPGINLHDLTQLLEESRHWNTPKPVPVEEEEVKEEERVLVDMGTGGAGEQLRSSGPAPPIKDHPAFSKYFKMLRTGASMDSVKEEMKKDGKDPTIADLDPEQSLSSQRPSMAEQEAVAGKPNAVENAQKALQEALLRKKEGPKVDVVIPKKDKTKQEEPDDNQNPQAKLMAALSKNKASAEGDRSLRADPEFAKYFKMLKMGTPIEAVKHAMTRDEKDPTVIELDPERSLKAQRPPPQSEGSDDAPPLDTDPDYAKYFKMLKMGMAKEQVAHAMTRDEKDPKILELDPKKSLKSQQGADGGDDDGQPLQDDPDYKKYFKMLKMGMAREQIAHALQRDGKDPKILDLDPKKSLSSQQKSEAAADEGPPLKDDEDYKKYFKMLKMGMAKEQVVHALQRDGKDSAVLDMDPNKSLASQQPKKDVSVDDGPALKDDPDFAKYFKMLKMGMPNGAVKNALARDGKDPSIMDLDPNKSVKSQVGGGGEPKDEGPPLKEDPEFVKYFKMLTMGLPKDAVKNALLRDGKDPSVMDLDPTKSLKFQMMGGGGGEEKDTGVPLKEDPEYAKYFKMMNMGLPKDAVKNALVRDGKDPAIMDLDPTKSVGFQTKKKSGAILRLPSKKKKKVRRKKIYWNPIQPEQIKEDSIWNLMRGSVDMEKLNYDVKEFEDLFTESADPADRQKNKRKKTDSNQQKKSVQVIDGKRSMNGGIILARMKVEYSIIAKAVDEMQHRKFDATQLMALKEFLPDQDERPGLKIYMKKGETDPEAKKKLYKDLSECEKYMYTIADVPKAAEKFDCMLFRNQFKLRFEDLIDAISTVEKACDETRKSERLRKMMATILTLVNQINTGGEGNEAAGFSLDALLKLNEAKAFDKKTSVLMYLAKLVKKNDESLLGFQDDLTTVRHAENIILDSVASDIKNIEADLKQVHETAAEEAARLEAAGELRPFSLADLKELKTTVYTVDCVPHFNKVDHHSGRTPMERFALNSHDALKQATKKIKVLKKKYASLLTYFGEDEKMASNEFFGTMRRFIEEFQKAHDEVEKLEMTRIKEEKRNAKRAEQEKKKSAKGGKASAAKPGKAAMANLASLAAAKSKTLGKSNPAGGAAPNPIVGGIAAMAAAAAAKSKPLPGGGIAAMTAAKNKPSAAPSAGGIAGLAAAAAAKKGAGGSGIAGLAAAAASKKSGTAPSSGGIAGLAAMAAKSKSSAIPASGGIAGLAAAAANNKLTSASALSAGGIAGLAAAAAKNKSSSESAPSAGGIAGLAAAAAARNNPAAGGIAGLAAMAANTKSTPSAPSAPPAGGIAGLAAMAAKNKAASNSAPPAGIAAMAAAAATQRKTPAANPPAPGFATVASAETKPAPARMSGDAIGGLTAMVGEAQTEAAPSKNDASLAAMAATSISSDDNANAVTGSTAQTSLAALAASNPLPPPSGSTGSGIGGLAGMAAAAKSKKNDAAGGLAALAASVPTSRGVSAALSDTPRKRKVYDETSGLYNDKEESSSAEFSAAPNATLFQLGSSGGVALPTRSKTPAGTLSRVPHRRHKSGDGSIFVPKRQTITRSKSDAASGNWANFQSDVVTNGASAAPGDWIAKSTSFPVHGQPITADPLAELARSQSVGGETAGASSAPANLDDGFMAALGWSPSEEGDNNKSNDDPSISFSMKRPSRKDQNSSDFDPGT